MENNKIISKLTDKKHMKNNSRNIKMKIIDIDNTPFELVRKNSSWQIERDSEKNVFLSSDKENNSILNYLIK